MDRQSELLDHDLIIHFDGPYNTSLLCSAVTSYVARILTLSITSQVYLCLAHGYVRLLASVHLQNCLGVE